MNADVLLVPVDLAGPTQPVVDMAVKLARALDCVVTLLHVVHLPVGVPPAGALPVGLIDTETALGVLDQEAGSHLDGLAAAFRSHGLPVSHLVRHGEPAETIMTVAEELGARHIVMGTHGRRGLERALLGSVAERVIRRAGCPVTIIRTPEA
ncbi:universal stress protein [Myxococcota bacterium]|nr:universal stress protein [Myxococcota bacterium]